MNELKVLRDLPSKRLPTELCCNRAKRQPLPIHPAKAIHDIVHAGKEGTIHPVAIVPVSRVPDRMHRVVADGAFPESPAAGALSETRRAVRCAASGDRPRAFVRMPAARRGAAHTLLPNVGPWLRSLKPAVTRFAGAIPVAGSQ